MNPLLCTLVISGITKIRYLIPIKQTWTILLEIPENKLKKSSFNSTIKHIQSKNIFYAKDSTKLCTISSGKIVGENDARNQSNCTLSVKCKSLIVQCFRIKADEFINHIKYDNETWQKFWRHWTHKDKDYKNKVSILGLRWIAFLATRKIARRKL